MLKPFAFGRFVARCPCLLCVGIMFILFIVMALISGYSTELISESTPRDYWPEGNADIDAYDAFIVATESGSDTNTSADPQSQRLDAWVMDFYFTLADYKNDISDDTSYWLMTRENIATMIQWEDRVVLDEDWQNRLCFVGEDPETTNFSCSAAIYSPARDISNLADYALMTDDDIEAYMINNTDAFAIYFNPEFAEYEQTYLMRTFLHAGGPIATSWNTRNGRTVHNSTFLNPQDEAAEQEAEYGDWAYPMFEEMVMDTNGELKSDDGNLEIMIFTLPVIFEAFNAQLGSALLFMGSAVLAVLVYMSIHLGSIFLAAGSLFQILMAFPCTILFYRGIFQIEYLGFLNWLILFVLLGVGADDVFVFTDAWKQSAHFVNTAATTKQESKCCVAANEEANVLRMCFSFRRAAKAMLVTQTTTFFAFLATASSPLMLIEAFGYWAALVVGMNYILVITLYPAILMIHHRFVKKYEDPILCALCRLCNTRSSSKASTVATTTDNDAGTTDNTEDPPSIIRQVSVEEAAEEYGCFEKFLGRTYVSYIQRFKFFTIAAFVVLFIVMAIFGFQIEPEDEAGALFPDDHWFTRLIETSQNFPSSDLGGTDIFMTFGIAGIDRDDAPMWDATSYGTVVWDNDFSMSSAESQQYLLGMCTELRASELVYDVATTVCPIDEFRLYLNANDMDFPYEASNGEASFASVFRDYLLSSYASAVTMTKKLSFVERDEASDEWVVRYYTMSGYSGEIYGLSPTSEIKRVKAEWEDWLDSAVVQCPAQLCDSVTQFSIAYTEVMQREAFVTSALQGIAIALPLAFVILLISTRNWIISLFAIADICGVMVCELAIMHLAGWKLGPNESVAVVIIT